MTLNRTSFCRQSELPPNQCPSSAMKPNTELSAGFARISGYLLMSLLMTLLATNRVHGQANPNVPERMTYQGFLVDANGVALGNTSPQNYDVIFSIFNEQSGGASQWSEQQTVTVDKGYFSVLLGEGAGVGQPALSTLFRGPTASERYIGMTVKGIGAGGTDVNILPRLRLLTSPYAFLAQQANKLVQNTGVDLISANGNQVTVAGPMTANSFIGNGANLTALNANNITAGTFAADRVPNHLTGTRTFSGPVGIGGGTPNYPLSLGGGLANTKLAIWDGGASSAYGFGVQPGQFRFHVNQSSDRYSFFDSPNGTEILTLRGNGRLGLGNTDPQVRFHASDNSAHVGRIESSSNIGTWLTLRNSTSGGRNHHFISTGSGNGEGAGRLIIDGGSTSATSSSGTGVIIGGAPSLQVLGGVLARGGAPGGNAANNNGYAFLGNSGDNDSGMYSSSDGLLQFYSNSQETMRVVAGRVGIGSTSNPDYPLHVKSSVNYGLNLGFTTVTFPISIKADQYLFAVGLLESSDLRIKNVVGLSDTESDLATLRKLRVTDYVMKDGMAHGDRPFKGFIAQEIQTIIPEAVNVGRDFVPDIYAAAEKVEYQADKEMLSVSMKETHTLKVGEKVRLIVNDGQMEAEVVNVDSPTTFDVSVAMQDAPEQVFVYGRQVDDFLSIDYNRLFTAGIGAIQELARQVDAVKVSEAKVTELEKRLERMEALEAEVADLRRTVQQLASLERVIREAAAAGNGGLGRAEILPVSATALIGDR